MLNNSGRAVVDEGLKYVHNDTCYPALLVIGQFIDAIKRGSYDPHKVALFITQTGGGCRASNYIHLLRKALDKAGHGLCPRHLREPSGLEKNPGFSLTVSLIRKLHLRHDVRRPHRCCLREPGPPLRGQPRRRRPA